MNGTYRSPCTAATAPRASATSRKRRSVAAASCDNVLSAEGKARQEPLGGLEEAPAPGKEEQVVSAHYLERGSAEEPLQLAPRQELHVLVERAVADDPARERVQRVVLEDRDEPAGPDDARRLTHERQPVGAVDAVEGAGREPEVGPRVAVGEPVRLGRRALDLPAGLHPPLVARGRDV